MAVVNPVGKNGVGKSDQKRCIISYVILSFFGFLAYVVLVTLFLALKLPKNTSFLLTGLITSVYQILNFELFFLGKKNSNNLIWEVYRFALVGLMAAVFDFAACYVVQFLVFKNATDWYVTFLSVTAGFAIGVTINYFLSTYMVYKASKSNMSKTTKGVIIFVVLSAIGLGLGIGIQYLLYDYLNVQKEIAFFSYPVDFVIRTLVVMFYNYVSRKLIIYK
jgi:putative flippase GtrA